MGATLNWSHAGVGDGFNLYSGPAGTSISDCCPRLGPQLTSGHLMCGPQISESPLPEQLSSLIKLISLHALNSILPAF